MGSEKLRRRHTSKGKYMNREDIIRMAREAGCKPFRSPEHWDDVQVFATPDVLERFAALVAAAERNKLAAWMMRQGYATGHGDTVEDLLKELEWQIEERISNEREACAKVCEDATSSIQVGKNVCTNLTNAIRARGE